jgi:sec-independent protein translocase protein TatA
MPNLKGSEWLIIILLVVLLFGAKRLPDAARSIGRSLRIFKAETKGLVDEQAAPAPGAAPAAVPGSTTPAVEGSAQGGGASVAPGTGAAQPEPVTNAVPPPGDASGRPHPETPAAPARGQPQA